MSWDKEIERAFDIEKEKRIPLKNEAPKIFLYLLHNEDYPYGLAEFYSNGNEDRAVLGGKLSALLKELEKRKVLVKRDRHWSNKKNRFVARGGRKRTYYSVNPKIIYRFFGLQGGGKDALEEVKRVLDLIQEISPPKNIVMKKIKSIENFDRTTHLAGHIANVFLEVSRIVKVFRLSESRKERDGENLATLEKRKNEIIKKIFDDDRDKLEELFEGCLKLGIPFVHLSFTEPFAKEEYQLLVELEGIFNKLRMLQIVDEDLDEGDEYYPEFKYLDPGKFNIVKRYDHPTRQQGLAFGYFFSGILNTYFRKILPELLEKKGIFIPSHMWSFDYYPFLKLSD